MTAATLIDQTRITTVWHALGGGQIRRNRGQAWWRRGDGWSVSLSDERGTWYDHRDGIGGGVLDLIQRVRGGSRGDALRWLADWRGVRLAGDAPLSPVERRRYAQAHRAAPKLARAAWLWWRERREVLEEAKAEALEHGDLGGLIVPAREHYHLGQLSPEGVIHEYVRARRDDPEGTEALLSGAERWARLSEALVTLLIARWAHDAGVAA